MTEATKLLEGVGGGADVATAAAVVCVCGSRLSEVTDAGDRGDAGDEGGDGGRAAAATATFSVCVCGSTGDCRW